MWIYRAQDINSKVDYALKRLFGTNKEECDLIIREISLHKQISGHPNIVKFITASFIDHRSTSQQGGRVEYLLVTELARGGSLYDCLDQTFEPEHILKIFYQATKAVSHLHENSINHRDIKVSTMNAREKISLCRI